MLIAEKLEIVPKNKDSVPKESHEFYWLGNRRLLINNLDDFNKAKERGMPFDEHLKKQNINLKSFKNVKHFTILQFIKL